MKRNYKLPQAVGKIVINFFLYVKTVFCAFTAGLNYFIMICTQKSDSPFKILVIW